jgi:hypothetical protein
MKYLHLSWLTLALLLSSAARADSPVKAPDFQDTSGSCSEYPRLLNAAPQLKTFGAFAFRSAECSFYKEDFRSDAISMVSLAIEYTHGKEKMTIGIAHDSGTRQLNHQIQTEEFERPKQPKGKAVSQLKILDYAMTGFGFVNSPEYPEGIRYAQYSGLYKNRYSVTIDIHGPALLNGADVDKFVKPYLEAFNFGALQ